MPSLFDLLDDPGTRVVPHFDTDSDPVRTIEDETECVVRALRSAVQKIPDSYLPAAASSAFHVQPFLEALCCEFERPVKNLQISDDGFVIVNIALRGDANRTARFAMGPHGEGAQSIEWPKTKVGGYLDSSISFHLGRSLIDNLKRAGLVSRQDAETASPASDPASGSPDLPATESPPSASRP